MVEEHWMYNNILRVVAFKRAIAVKFLTSFLASFLRSHKDIANLPGFFGHAGPNPSKTIVSAFK